MIFRKEGYPAVGHLLRQVIPVGGRPSRDWVNVIRTYLRKVNRLKRDMGLPGVVKYLKVASVSLQQSVAGYYVSDCGSIGFRIGRTSTGIPLIIPSYHRKLIRKGDVVVIRFWLTLFSIFRDIIFPGTLKLSTITGPSTATSEAGLIEVWLPRFKDLFFGQSNLDSLSEAKLFPILTSGPQASGKEKTYNSGAESVIRSAHLFNDPSNSELKKALQQLMTLTKSSVLEHFFNLIIKLDIQVKPLSRFLGRLAIKEEAAGKVRVFAMVDPWTQWVLRPLHKFLFNLLDKLPMDGTFDQLKPLSRVPFGRVPIYSLDLSAATDRLPIGLQVKILQTCFGEKFAKAWATLLVARPYKHPEGAEGLVYSVGQPMGALSSWAMLATTHHFIVQACAWSVGLPNDKLFTEYAVLGDDIVIWNHSVAKRYIRTMKALGVELGIAKSIVSPKGIGLEFAKRTILKNGDVSPVPFKESAAAHVSMASFMQFCKKYNLTPLKGIRFLGYGYKVRPSKLTLRMSVFRLVQMLPKNFDDLYKLWEEIVYPNLFTTSGDDIHASWPLGQMVDNSFLGAWTGTVSPFPLDLEEQEHSPEQTVESFRVLVAVLRDIVQTQLKQSQQRRWSLVQKKAELEASIRVFSTDYTFIKFQNQALQMEFSKERLLNSLGSCIAKCQVSLEGLSWVEGILKDATPDNFQYPVQLFTIVETLFNHEIFQNIQRTAFSVDQELQLSQVADLISPKIRTPNESEPSYMEQRAALELWRRWSLAFHKANISLPCHKRSRVSNVIIRKTAIIDRSQTEIQGSTWTWEAV